MYTKCYTCCYCFVVLVFFFLAGLNCVCLSMWENVCDWMSTFISIAGLTFYFVTPPPLPHHSIYTHSCTHIYILALTNMHIVFIILYICILPLNAPRLATCVWYCFVVVNATKALVCYYMYVVYAVYVWVCVYLSVRPAICLSFDWFIFWRSLPEKKNVVAVVCVDGVVVCSLNCSHYQAVIIQRNMCQLQVLLLPWRFCHLKRGRLGIM